MVKLTGRSSISIDSGRSECTRLIIISALYWYLTSELYVAEGIENNNNNNSVD